MCAWDGGQVVATRPMYGGKVLADVSLAGSPAIVAIRPRAMEAVAASGAGEVETVTVNLEGTVLNLVEKNMESGKIDLTEADVVITGGRGMGGEDFCVVENLAQTVGGAVGASRSAVDEGWRPVSDQVGQTGKVVAPNLYVACGVSGAIQHLAGMASSRVVVAVNKDPEGADLFQMRLRHCGRSVRSRSGNHSGNRKNQRLTAQELNSGIFHTRAA